MKAKEMFEKLGYKYRVNDLDMVICSNEFFGGSVELVFEYGLGMRVIVEDNIGKDWEKPNYEFCYEELQAISKQCKEMGMYEESK